VKASPLHCRDELADGIGLEMPVYFGAKLAANAFSLGCWVRYADWPTDLDSVMHYTEGPAQLHQVHHHQNRRPQ
jgi:hypothetical protein